MENKNKKSILIIGILLAIVIVPSLAYFVAKTIIEGNGANVNMTTANIKGAVVKVDGELSFEDQNVEPGHKTLSIIKVTATGNNEFVPYNVFWTGTNNLNSNLKLTIYKTESKVEGVEATCERKKKIVNGSQILSEECEISNINSLGSIYETSEIAKKTTDTKTYIVNNELITATEEGTVVYYYVVVEYQNLGESQNIDISENIEKSLDGKIAIEGVDSEADINILSINIKEKGSYKTVTELPTEGNYKLNKQESSCTNNSTPLWRNKKLLIKDLKQSGTTCELYFDEYETAKNVIINSTTLKEDTPNFSKTSCDQTIANKNGSATCGVNEKGGLYKTNKNTEDDKDVYYYRGSVNNNWLKFGQDKDGQDIWWRIIRINEDNTIRIIYAGVGEEAPIGKSEYFMKGGYGIDQGTYFAFNSSTYDDNAYVGFMYTKGLSQGTGTSSNAKQKLDAWYNNNLTEEEEYINGNTGFCGDRTKSTSSSGEPTGQGGTNKTVTYYGAYLRLVNTPKNPIYKCSEKVKDLYTTNMDTNTGNKALTYPIGLITADEVAYAGGVYEENNYGYWLYTGQNYWTMSPGYFNSSHAYVFSVVSSGHLRCNYVNAEYGLRPVINLNSDVVITEGSDGTISNPFIVELN